MDRKNIAPNVVEFRRVETSVGLPTADPDIRLRQQALLAQLGVQALQGAPLSELIDAAASMAAAGLDAEFSKVLEFIPGENRLLVRAGVGWEPGIVNKATVGADLASPAGYALRTGPAVISNHLGSG